MQHPDNELFEEFVQPMIGLPLSHLWCGHGIAIFLEFGKPTPRKRRDGSDAAPGGEMCVMLEGSWRIEGRKGIICGIWTEEDRWERGFRVLRGQKLIDVTLFGRLPEIDLSFENGAHCVSFTVIEGHPEWVIFDRHHKKTRWLRSKYGRLFVEEA
ncbi:MAG: hypothetical protein ACR2OR_11910 [Hyphomicrobiales bacterium]